MKSLFIFALIGMGFLSSGCQKNKGEVTLEENSSSNSEIELNQTSKNNPVNLFGDKIIFKTGILALEELQIISTRAKEGFPTTLITSYSSKSSVPVSKVLPIPGNKNQVILFRDGSRVLGQTSSSISTINISNGHEFSFYTSLDNENIVDLALGIGAENSQSNIWILTKKQSTNYTTLKLFDLTKNKITKILVIDKFIGNKIWLSENEKFMTIDLTPISSANGNSYKRSCILEIENFTNSSDSNIDVDSLWCLPDGSYGAKINSNSDVIYLMDSDQNDNAQVWLLDSLGEKKISEDNESVSFISWNPLNNSSFIYLSNSPDFSGLKLFDRNLETTKELFSAISSNSSQSDICPTWGSDGNEIYFSSQNSRWKHLYKFSMKTEKVTQITSPMILDHASCPVLVGGVRP